MKFRDFITEASTYKANNTSYSIKAIVSDKGDKHTGKTFHIVATPKDNSEIIAFTSLLNYVGEAGTWYLAQLGYTDGYDNGTAVPTQPTPNLDYYSEYINSEIIPALEGKNKTYTNITHKFPKGTKMKYIISQLR